MKKSLIIGIVALFAVLFIAGFYFFNQNNKNGIADTDTNSNLEEINDYIGESTTTIHKDFRAVIKNDWKEYEIPPSIYFYLPSGVSQEDVNAEVISVAVTPLGENQYNLDSLLEQGIENSKKILPDFELIETKDWSNEHFTGKKIKFTGTSEEVKRSSLQVFGIELNNLYAITYSCPVNNCNSYGVYNSFVESFEPVKAEQKTN